MTHHRAAIVGTGFIGPVHVEGLRRAGVEVVGILGSTLSKSQAAAEKLRIPTAYGSYSELLADGGVDVVHLTTPNRFHHAEALTALDAGKHVLCEKPLAMNARESAELVVRAAQSDRLCGVNYNVRFYPLCQEVRARIAAGELGRLFHVAGSYVQDWLLYDTDFNWRVLADDGGELRAMADIGTHCLDLVQFVTGQNIVAICADLQTVHPTRRRPIGGVETFSDARNRGDTEPVAITTDDYGALLLEFDSGARGLMWVSQVTAGRKNCLRFEIAGANSAAAWNSESPNELWLGQRSEPNRLLVRDPALMTAAARQTTDYPGGHNEGFPDTFKQLFRAFYGFIANGDRSAPPPYPTFADGHREIVLCEAILRSHRERCWVMLGE
ncbi:MAG TPA: Gfo/Idh/MocA family oxidoreductase [Planctomycetaceae bacterium]|nr:Gfo/Idh/MocA family oxidoreductase [Planctomycetaceae bacterium]